MNEIAPAHRTTIERFAGTMGLDAPVGPDGSVGFAFERTGTLVFVPAGEGAMLVTLSRSAAEAPGAEALLMAAGHDAALGACVHAGLTPAGRALAWVRLEAGLGAYGGRFEVTDIEACRARLRAVLGAA